MNDQNQLNFYRISKAIDYIQQNFKNQPNLDEIADKVNLSPFHFQRIFLEWAGTTPKKFLQYISLEHAKSLLKEQKISLFDTAWETGLSGTSRLHDLFVKIEGMTPAEYKNGGRSLKINYNFTDSPFGNLLIASTHKGICSMTFIENENIALEELRQKYPNAMFEIQSDGYQQSARMIFQKDWSKIPDIKLHLKGTPFQLKVWEALLKIPIGKLTTYGDIAKKIEQPNASRAVGTAIGSNPIAYLIPCHRVIQSSGFLGGYMWGKNRKAAIIGWEGVMVNTDQ